MWASIIEHAIIGVFITCTGAWATCRCPGHRAARIFLFALLIFVEAVLITLAEHTGALDGIVGMIA